MAKKRRITEQDYVKANRKASREEEITAHGHPLSRTRVHKSKKVYDRKKTKAGFRKSLPFDLGKALDNPLEYQSSLIH